MIMNLLPCATDNISELLIKIIEFTHFRHKTIIQNIRNINNPGFVPKDLNIEEFCDLLNKAINEYLQNQRLVLCDTENIKFGSNSDLVAIPSFDECAKELLEENLFGYLEMQIDKLRENSLNQRAAAELLRRRRGIDSTDYWTIYFCEDENQD
jgi:flagellar basal body rod protein FlgB